MGKKLNPKQRSWLSKFLQQYPYYKLKQVRSGLSGDRYLHLEGIEPLPLAVVPDLAAAFPGYRLHTLDLQLRVYGDLRCSAKHSCTTVYPHCQLGEPVKSIEQTGQLELRIPTAILAVTEPKNPAVYSWKPKRQALPKLGVQLCLPVTGMEAELYRLRQETRPYLPPVSSQELLAEKVQTWSLRDSISVEVPQVLLDLLRKHSASEDESQNAIDLFEVAGLSCSLMYVEALPNWRKRDTTTVSTVAASQAVERATIKPTTVPLQVKTQN